MSIVTYVPPEIIHRAETIAWANTLGVITAEALAERDAVGTVEAKARLDETVSLGFMNKRSVLVGYSDLYGATPAGRRLARKHAAAGGYAYPNRLRSARVAIKEARHTIACASVIAALERRYPDDRVVGERELRRDESHEERRLGSVDVPRPGVTRSHFPDLLIWPSCVTGGSPPLPIAVEVELSPKPKAIRTAICRAWAGAPHIEMVLYYAETATIETLLLGTIEELKAEDRIVVNPLGEIIKSLPGFNLAPAAD
jgi:hypothetical protein